MKYILVIGDGMADNPVPELGGKTPLETADIPHIDALAAAGTLGSVRNCPEGFPPGSDTAIMSIFGCSPRLYYSGRAPLEAADQGIELENGDAAFRCNNVALSDADDFDKRKMLSHSAGGISGAEGRELIEYLFSHPEFKPLAEKARMSINPTDSYRHIAVQKQADIKGIVLAPPHDHLNESVSDIRPHGCADADVLYELMKKATEILEKHPVNLRRKAEGKLPANGIWFWAEGTAAKLPNFVEHYGATGGVVSAVPLCHGIAKMVGLQAISVDGATGEWETNYEGKVEAALKVLENNDFAALHLEGPDECSHNGQLKEKVQAIEWLDSRVVEPVCAALRAKGESFRMLILSDHKTLMANGQHDGTPVPFIIYDSRVSEGSGLGYTEKNGEKGPYVDDGVRLMSMLFQTES